MGQVSSLEDIIETFFANNFEHNPTPILRSDEKRLRELADRLLHQVRSVLGRPEFEVFQAIEAMRGELAKAQRELTIEQHARAQDAARLASEMASLRSELSELRETFRGSTHQFEAQVASERAARECAENALVGERQRADESEKQKKEAKKEVARLSREPARLRSALSECQSECARISSERSKLEAQVMSTLVDKRLPR